MKIVAIIPALLNSERVPNKNLLLVDGFPLIYYVVKACKESNIFSDIYISSDDTIFEKMSQDLGVKFFKREKEMGGSNCIMENNSKICKGERCTIHDHFLYDFITKIKSDYLVQIHTTSPLISPETIRSFVMNLTNNFDSLVTVTETQSESFLDGDPINFDINSKQPTQTLSPIESISWALSGWKSETFQSSYKDGPTFCGNSGRHPISKIESIDVDTMEDLYIAEACLNHRKRSNNVGKWYYNENMISIEKDLKDLISNDGSPIPNDNKILGHNETLMNLDKIKYKIGDSIDTWCYPIVYTDNDQIAFIKQSKGDGCRKHFHPTKDEWWVIFEGIFEYKIWNDYQETDGDPDDIIIARKDDIVFIEKGKTHIITCISDEPGTRLACGSRDMSHVYMK